MEAEKVSKVVVPARQTSGGGGQLRMVMQTGSHRTRAPEDHGTVWQRGSPEGKQVLHPALVSAVTLVGKAQSLAGYLHSGMNNFVCTQH